MEYESPILVDFGEGDGNYNSVINPLTGIIMKDDTPEFVREMKEMFDDELEMLNNFRLRGETYTLPPMLCPSDILDEICIYRAVNCAMALLKGETGFAVDLNVESKGRYPLHRAAKSLNYELVDLFLRHGAQADVRSGRDNLLPLDYALLKFHSHSYLLDWTPKDSIYKLITILCLPQMKKPLEIVRLLSGNTKDLEDAFLYYAKEEKVMEMAILLMAAKEVTSIFQRITDEIGLVVFEKANNYILKKKNPLAQKFKQKMVRLQFAMQLLCLFERIGDAIRLYLQSQESNASKDQVVKEIKRILKDVGFVSKNMHFDLSSIDCESYEINEANAGSSGSIKTERCPGFQYMYSNPVTIAQAQSRPTQMQVGQGNAFCSHPFSSLGFEPLAVACQCRNYSAAAFSRPIKAQYRGEMIAKQRPYKPSNLLASFASSLKRGMRHL